MSRELFQAFLWMLFSFKGRLPRLPFICFQLGAMPLTSFYYHALHAQAEGVHPQGEHVILIAFGCFLIWTGAAVLAKRLHDVDFKGWWVPGFPALSVLSRYLFWIALAAIALVPGEQGANRFGTRPPDWKKFFLLKKMETLDRAFAEGRIDAATFNARRQEILPATPPPAS